MGSTNSGKEQNVWLPELLQLGYTEKLPKPAHIGIQALLATIEDTAVHKFIQQHDGELAGREDCGSQTYILGTLGLQEFFVIADIACKTKDGEALEKLQAFVKSLDTILEKDNEEYCEAEEITRKIVIALHRKWEKDSSTSVTVNRELAARLQNNPHFRMKFFHKEEQVVVKTHIERLDMSQATAKNGLNGGDQYVPVFPARNYEWELAKFGGRCWEAPNLNQLAPINIQMWKNWGTISDADVENCKARALIGDAPAKRMLGETTWPMNVFSGGKYKCAEPTLVRNRMDLKTGDDRESKHNSKFWNWQRSFFKCDCMAAKEKKLSCDAKMMWFDQGIWYMITHLELFFNATDVGGRMMLLLVFLSIDGREAVLDHITFLFIWEMMIKAMMELYIDPGVTILKDYGKTPSVKMIERLIKPKEFTMALLEEEEKSKNVNKRKIDINNTPVRNTEPARKNMFRNNTPPGGWGRGRGNSTFYYGQSSRSSFGKGCFGSERGNGNFCNNQGNFQGNYGSPLQRRNIDFD
ncbi:unnamed protein product [Calypogeia fissa]